MGPELAALEPGLSSTSLHRADAHPPRQGPEGTSNALMALALTHGPGALLKLSSRASVPAWAALGAAVSLPHRPSWPAEWLPGLSLDLLQHRELAWWSRLLVEPGHHLRVGPARVVQVLEDWCWSGWAIPHGSLLAFL